MAQWTSAFRWLEASISLSASLFRWPPLFASYLTPPPIWSWSSTLDPGRWAPHLRLPEVDDVIWSVVSAVESVALVSFLCFFFVFCGCTI
ncbi:hypothetical protein ABFS83_02G090700 [Erythranthe nasuta]